MPIVQSCSSYNKTYIDNRYILSLLNQLNARMCSIEVKQNTVSSIPIEGVRIEFLVGDPDDNMMNEGDNVLLITDKNIIEDTVEVFVNGSIVSRKANYPLNYTVSYSNSQISITFNTGLYNDNQVVIKYLKKSS